MKQLVTALVIFVSAVPTLAGQHPSGSPSRVVTRGATIAAEAKSVTVTQLLENPDAYGKEPVVVEGVVSKVCWIQGCWMNVAPEVGARGIHVTFRGFTVPRSSKGSNARMVGVVKTTTKEGKSHVSFVASGVELRH